MPSALTYPGVYVEEIPSGVRTITGVSTSIAAFLGRTARGPVGEAVTITSWADFERQFGGLDVNYPVSYSVRDFYLNGGATAIVVRLFKGGGTAALSAQGLSLVAASPGTWGNNVRARVETSTGVADVAAQLGVATTDLFNLIVRDTKSGTTETFVNVTTVDSARRIDRVLANHSTLVRTASGALTHPSGPHGAPAAGKTVWEDDTASAKVTTAVTDSTALNASTDYVGVEADKTGLYTLAKADLFNILCIPPDAPDTDLPTGVHAAAIAYCVKRRAMLLVDPPSAWTTVANVDAADVAISGPAARNAAVYFPNIRQANPLRGDVIENFPPSGTIAGVMARTDVTRGVWKAPAGVDAALNGAVGLSVPLTDEENGLLNPLGINCLRTFPVFGTVAWGARTMRGADMLGDEYKYIPVRRLALFLEESLYRGIQWAVFEPNDEPLWAQIRLNVGAFLHGLFRQGAFQGGSPRDAYFVKCDKDTTTQNDINLGIVNVVVGFAPLKPAEFVVLKIQQIAGQVQA